METNIYKMQKIVIEDLKNKFLKASETEKQRNQIKELCNDIAREHRLDHLKIKTVNERVIRNQQIAVIIEIKQKMNMAAKTERQKRKINDICNQAIEKYT